VKEVFVSRVFKYSQQTQSRGGKLISAPPYTAPKENYKCLTFLSLCSLSMFIITRVQRMNTDGSEDMDGIVG